MLGMSASPLWFLLHLFLLVSPTTVGAQNQPSVASVEAWLDAEISGKNAFGSFASVRMALRTHSYAEFTAGQLSAMEAEVGGKPDHPKRMIVEATKRRLTAPDETVLLAFWRAPNHWRICRTDRFLKVDLPPAPVGNPVNGTYPADTKWTAPRTGVEWYLDCCQGRDYQWKLSPESLAFTTPDAGFPAAQGVEGWWLAFTSHADRHLTGGLAVWAEREPRRLGPVNLRGFDWACDVGTTTFQSRYSGRWDAAANRGFVEEIRPQGDKSPVGRYVMEKWAVRTIESKEVWCAENVRSYSRDGQLRTLSSLTELDVLSDEVFEQVTQLPDAARADPIRGEVTIRTVDDFGDPEVRRSRTLGQPPVLADTGPRTAGGETLRILGWVILGVLGVLLVIIRMRLAQRRSADSNTDGS